MTDGHFYFLKDQYFADFKDPYLAQNRSSSDGCLHDRPCFCAFRDTVTGLYWMVPCSSQISKFQSIYQKKVQRMGHCETIDFGEILGHRKAFLLQNMCPATDVYVKNEYLDPISGLPVRLDGVFEKRLIQNTKKVLALYRKGVKLIFPDVLKIEAELLGNR